MRIPVLGEARFPSPLTRTTPDNLEVPAALVREARQPSESPEPSFELAGARSKLYFSPPHTRAGIVTCGGLCPGLNDVIRSLFLELHFGYGVKEVIGFRGGYQGLDPSPAVEPVVLTPAFVDTIHQNGGTVLKTSRGPVDIGRAVDTLVHRGVNSSSRSAVMERNVADARCSTRRHDADMSSPWSASRRRWTTTSRS